MTFGKGAERAPVNDQSHEAGQAASKGACEAVDTWRNSTLFGQPPRTTGASGDHVIITPLSGFCASSNSVFKDVIAVKGAESAPAAVPTQPKDKIRTAAEGAADSVLAAAHSGIGHKPQKMSA